MTVPQTSWPGLVGLIGSLTYALVLTPYVIALWRNPRRSAEILASFRRLGLDERLIFAALRGAVGSCFLALLFAAGFVVHRLPGWLAVAESSLIVSLCRVTSASLEWVILAVIVGYASAMNLARPKWILPKVLRDGPGLFR